ncbi:deaminase [Bacillus cytotoxicus]|uniref:deaminase n=1 Tax=Bacillus cytotoxicus TaxID=580165 RepID=UPI0024497DE0|nr:deaminase [Bacillus cytotoxicus]MDH2882424.1 deaminase [Bacillus cytotoxicus]
MPPKKNNPKHLGHAQSLTHTKSHSLIRAFEKQGSLPGKVTMYVDQKTCNICRGELPALLKRLDVDELEVFSGGNTKPIIIIKDCSL